VEEKVERDTEAGLLAGLERVVKSGIRDSMEPISRIFQGATLIQERSFWQLGNLDEMMTCMCRRLTNCAKSTTL